MSKYRILTFDGGGIRGVLTATLLQRLNDELPKFIQMTKLFAGTSTGSIIALGLAYGLSPKELVDLFTSKSKFIFTPRHLELYRPKYDNDHLKKVISSVFPPNLRLADLPFSVVIPSFRVTGTSSKPCWSPLFFNNLPGSTTMNELVIDVILSSTAAPIYFPSYNEHIDGGVMANNPSTAAIAAARGLPENTKALEDMFLLSIGTGKFMHNITADTTKWGAIEWVLCPTPPFPLLSILLEGVLEADEYYSSQLLREQYYRLNVKIPEKIGPVPLDAYCKIPDLITLANAFNLEKTIKWIKNNWLP